MQKLETLSPVETNNHNHRKEKKRHRKAKRGGGEAGTSIALCLNTAVSKRGFVIKTGYAQTSLCHTTGHKIMVQYITLCGLALYALCYTRNEERQRLDAGDYAEQKEALNI